MFSKAWTKPLIVSRRNGVARRIEGRRATSSPNSPIYPEVEAGHKRRQSIRGESRFILSAVAEMARFIHKDEM
jgi:hypothetical protein